jgi:potassium efflux system protein
MQGRPVGHLGIGGWIDGLRMRLCLIALALLLTFGAAPVLVDAQTADPMPKADATGAIVPPTAPVAQKPAAVPGAVENPTRAVDLQAWERMAIRAETMLGNVTAATTALEQLRAQIVEWREALLGAQTANQARIGTIQSQIAALGPIPSEGQTEAAAIAERRAALGAQLSELEAPGLAAVEAYRRADGLIREIDAELRERQADALMQVWPAPVNPANWPEAVISLSDIGYQAFYEAQTNWNDKGRRAELFSAMPVIIVLMVVAFVLVRYGHRWIDRLVMRLQDRSSARWRRVWAFLASLGGLIIPMLGVLILTAGITVTGLPGPILTEITSSLGDIVWPVVVAAWLGRRLFPVGEAPGQLNLTPDRRAEGRNMVTLMGLMLAVRAAISVIIEPLGYSDGALAVISYPAIVVTSLILFRAGQLLQRHVLAEEKRGDAGSSYGLWLIGLVARGVKVVGVLAPILGAMGYVPGASVAVYSTLSTLALIGIVAVLQELISDIYAAITGADETGAKDGLIPVLADFALVVAAIPVLALIWGLRIDDLMEIWTRFREGFTIGSTKISPTNFIFFVVVFSIGFALTRALQRALKTSILPRTSLDRGGQTALVSGTGYLGIFLAGLIAINAAGIDLSGLAIVAGALSVGIGFGLQTIVSNFVSGIILLIERPVSEGDWIEVGTTQGIVKSISVRSTRIQTFDRSDVIVPNSDLITGRVTNWTRFNQTGRLIVPVTVPFTEDSRRIEAILREIVEAQPLAILSPAPIVALMGFAGEAMNFEIRVILRDVNFQLPVRSEINHQIAARFAAEGIKLSNAHRDSVLRRAELDLATQEAEAEARANVDAIKAAFAPEAVKPVKRVGAARKAKAGSEPEEQTG